MLTPQISPLMEMVVVRGGGGVAQGLSEFRATHPQVSPPKGMGAQYLPEFKGASPPLSPTMGIEREGGTRLPII